jgi:hypothetical protein
MAALMFTACPMDSGGGGGGPKPEDLPELPAGTTYVTNETEAKALLGALKPGFQSIRSQVGNLISPTNTDSGYSWNVTDNTSISGLKVNSRGAGTEKTNIANPEAIDNFDDLKQGDWMEYSETSDTTVEFTGDKTVSDATVYQGSKSVDKASELSKMTIKSISNTGGTVTVNVSGEASQQCGVTASIGGKGGKIILEAGARGSLNGDYNLADMMGDDIPTPSPSITYSGSLKVYGADNAVVYELSIKGEDTYDEAVSYFSYN